MRRSGFDGRLFADGFRQLSVSGLLCGLVMALQVVLIPIGNVLISRESSPAGQTVVNLWNLNPMALSMYCVIAPLMTLYLFRFLSHRDACDYYHAIPQTRECLYFSFAAAVLSWAFLLQWGSTLLGILVHMILGRYFQIQIGEILLQSLIVSACVIFVVGAVLLAVTLTGNALTNLIVSLLIIFFPRLMMLAVRLCVGDSLSIIVNSNYLQFLGNGWNAVTGSIFGVLDGMYSGVFMNIKAGIYTAALGILYLGIGCVMFKRRRSEAAGEASIHPVLQLIFRLIPAAVFCLIPNIQIYENTIHRRSLAGSDIYWLFVLYLIAVVIYFAYELVSTRKVRNLPKAVPGLLILAVFNLAVVFGMLGMRRELLSYRPEASEIESVRILGTNVYVYTDEESGVIPGYFSSRLGDVELTNDSVKELTATRLAESIAYDEKGSEEMGEEYYQMQEVAIKVNGRTTFRTIRLLMTDVRRLGEALYETGEVTRIYMSMPDAADPNVNVNVTNNMGNLEFDSRKEISEEVYSALCEDVEEMGFDNWYALCNDNRNVGVFTVYVRVLNQSRTSGIAVPVNNSTPKAFQICAARLQEQQGASGEEMQEKISVLRKNGEQQSGVTYSNASVYMVTPDGEYIGTDLEDENALAVLEDLLKKQGDIPVDVSKGFLILNLDMEYYADGTDTDEVRDRPDYESYYGAVILAMPEDMDPYLKPLGLE